MATGSAQQSNGQDVVEFLLGQHREVERLFGELRQASGEGRRHAFEHLVRLLAVHETAEEEVVYPALRQAADDGDAVADARTSEESEAKDALSELEKIGPDGAEFPAKLQAFEQLVLTHARNEEREVFPRLRQSQDPERLEQMAKAVEAAEAVAPTHPHPHGPESALGNLVVGPFVAVVDRVRDAIRGASR